MRNKYKVLLLLIVVLLVVTITCGYSYSLWSVSHTQETSNVVNTGCFEVTFSEAGSNINLTNTYPISDTKGLVTTPYTFTITNTCSIASNASIMINPQTGTTLSLDYIKAGIKETSESNYTYKLLKSYTEGTIASGDTTSMSSYILTTAYLKPNATKTYSIIMWLGEDAGNDTQGKTLQASIKVSDTATKTLTYSDTTGASQPELYQGMIPVKYDATGNVVVADTTQEWYNYANHNWANAVLVNCSDTTIKDKYFNSDMTLKSSTVGTTISMSDILQMYVWIPRYKYLLWNAANGSSDPQAITIVFEDKSDSKSTGSTNGTYLTHPAFTFGSTELNGIWVGKFEASGTTTNLTIKPNVTSLRSITLGDMFNATRNQELTYSSNYGIDNTKVDTHLMKNMEWGAVAYLSSSIYGRYSDASTCSASGCETWINNNSGFITGCSGASVSADADTTNTTACASGYDWTTLGVNASTTGNQYGIYDMSGGALEYVMGNMVDASGNYYPSKSGLTTVDSKYYDSYTYGTSAATDHARGKLGDATKETLKTFGSGTGGWYGDDASLPSSTFSWFFRGGLYNYGTSAGVFNFNGLTGGAGSNPSFRSAVALAQ